MTLLDLAKEFDATAQDALDARIALAEKIKALLGNAYPEFDAWHSGLVEAKDPAPATEALHRMGFAPLADEGHVVIEGHRRGHRPTIEITADRPARLVFLFNAGRYMLTLETLAGVDLPCSIPVGKRAALDLDYGFQAEPGGVVRFRFVVQKASTLLEFAKDFDETDGDPRQAEAHTFAGQQMRMLLGERVEEFNERYKAQGNVAATSVLCEMGLATIPPGAVASLWQGAEEYLRKGERPDWVSAMFILRQDMLAALRPPAVIGELPCGPGTALSEAQVQALTDSANAGQKNAAEKTTAPTKTEGAA